MKLYKVVFEIAVIKESALDAVKDVERTLRNDRYGFTYTVQDGETGELVTVDMSEEDTDAVLPLGTYEPLITNEESMVECDGCKTKIPETDLYCNNCGNENF